MLRVIVLLAIVATVALLPVMSFDQLVLPQLTGLRNVYATAELTAQKTTESFDNR